MSKRLGAKVGVIQCANGVMRSVAISRSSASTRSTMLASSLASLARQRSSIPLRSAAAISAALAALARQQDAAFLERLAHAGDAELQFVVAAIFSAPPQRAAQPRIAVGVLELAAGKDQRAREGVDLVVAHHHEDFEGRAGVAGASTGAAAGRSSPAAAAAVPSWACRSCRHCHYTDGSCAIPAGATAAGAASFRTERRRPCRPLTIPGRTTWPRASGRCGRNGDGSWLRRDLRDRRRDRARQRRHGDRVGGVHRRHHDADGRRRRDLRRLQRRGWGQFAALAAARRALCLRRLHLPAEPVPGRDPAHPDAGHRADRRRPAAHLPRHADEARHAVGLGRVLGHPELAARR